jgi:imidazolonepropionase-like amidohydrolase
MYVTGLSLQGPNDWRPSVVKAGDAQKIDQENVDGGNDFLKIVECYPEEHFAEAMAATKENGMYVTGHIPFEVGLKGAVTGGMDEIAHIVPILYWERVGIYTPGMTRNKFGQKMLEEYLNVGKETWCEPQKETISDIVELLRSNGTNVRTTGVGFDITRHLVFEPETFIERVDMKYARQRYLDLISHGEDGTQQLITQYPQLMEPFLFERRVWLREPHDAGIMLILGMDSGFGQGLVPGFSLQGELLTVIEAGFTPYEAIATGTVDASKVVEQMIRADDFGTIEVGKRADLILVGGNPLEDVTNIQDIQGVLTAGRWNTHETLDEMMQLDS